MECRDWVSVMGISSRPSIMSRGYSRSLEQVELLYSSSFCTHDARQQGDCARILGQFSLHALDLLGVVP